MNYEFEIHMHVGAVNSSRICRVEIRVIAVGSIWRRVLFAAAVAVFGILMHGSVFAHNDFYGDTGAFDIPPSEMMDAFQPYSEQAAADLQYTE